MFPRLLVLVSIAAASILMAAEQTQGDTNVPAPVAFQMSNEESEIIHFTNREREKEGLPALKFNQTLMELARKHSSDMAAAEKLAHTLDSKTYFQRLKDAKYQYLAAGENVAWNQPTPEAVVDSWMHSPGHRANILNKDFTEIGVGIARDPGGKPYYTQDFARPVSAGATASAHFSVSNHTEKSANISMPGQEGEAVLEPGGTGTFSISGMGKLPDIQVQEDNHTAKFSARNNGNFVISDTKDGIQVSEDKNASESNQ